jgi:hypothetical protein
MPSSLIIVALVVAWLLVLVPIVARRRQEVARTADSTLAARVVRSGGVRSTAEEESTMADPGEADTHRDTDEFEDFDDSGAEYAAEAEFDDGFDETAEYDGYEDEAYDDYERAQRPFRPGRGGFDPEAAAITARARYSFRQRVVVLMLMAALISGLVAVTVSPLLWWAHVAIDVGLVGYLGYLRRQVRIEEEIRERRTARLGSQHRAQQAARSERPAEHDAHGPADGYETEESVEHVVEPQPQLAPRRPVTRHVHPGTVVVDTDDEDPMFAELDEPGALPYRRAVGE